MKNNIEHFSVYAADIFRLLYDNFPMAENINANMMIDKYLDSELKDKIKANRIGTDMAHIIEGTIGLTDEQRVAAEDKQSRINELEKEVRAEKSKHIELFEGTLVFLLSEGYLRETGEGEYQLTAKGFSHLSMKFEDKSIKNTGNTFITAINTLFSSAAETTSKTVVSGVAAHIITSLLSS